MIKKGALDIEVFAQLANSPGTLLFCFSTLLIQLFINNYRWLILLRGQGFETGVGATLRLSLIGMFFNFAMPGGVGGDVIKGYYLLRQHPSQKFAAAVSIFMDRMMGFFVMIATAFLAISFNWNRVAHSPQLIAIAIAVSLLFLAFLLFYFLSLSRTFSNFCTWFWENSRVGQFIYQKVPGGRPIKNLYEAIHSYRSSIHSLFTAFLLSSFSQGSMIAFVYAIGQALGPADIPLSIYFFLVPLGVVALAIPISPAGIGVGQAAFFFLFNSYLGHESQLGPTAVTILQAMSFALGLVGAIFYLQQKDKEGDGQLQIEAL